MLAHISAEGLGNYCVSDGIIHEFMDIEDASISKSQTTIFNGNCQLHYLMTVTQDFESRRSVHETRILIM